MGLGAPNSQTSLLAPGRWRGHSGGQGQQPHLASPEQRAPEGASGWAVDPRVTGDRGMDFLPW